MQVRLVSHVPIKIVVIFIIWTIFMFVFSPWQWKSINYFYFFSLMAIYIGFLIAGYNYGLRKFKVNNFQNKKSGKINQFKLFRISLILNCLFLYPKLLQRLKVSSLSVGDFLDRSLVGIFSPSDAYSAKFENISLDLMSMSNPLTFLNFISSPIQYILIPIAIFYWRNLFFGYKFLVGVIVLIDILSYFAIGTNKGLFDYLIVFFSIYIIKHPDLFSATGKKLKKISTYIVSIFLLGLVVGYFSKNVKERRSDNFGYDYATNTYVDKENIILTLLPEFMEEPYISLDSYLTQGYYAMNLSFLVEHEFTYFVGHNTFLTEIFEKAFGGSSINQKKYQSKLENNFGYSSERRWHSFYMWFANDLTYFGIPFLMFFLGYFFSQIWIDSVYNRNFFAISLIPLFFTIFFYISANNQVLGNQFSAFTFWVLLFLWRRYRG